MCSECEQNRWNTYVLLRIKVTGVQKGTLKNAGPEMFHGPEMEPQMDLGPEPKGMTGRAWKLALVSEGEGC